MLLRQALAEERHEAATDTARPADSLSRLVDRNITMRAFLLRFLDPEDLGYTVNEALRDEVRALLGVPRVLDR